MGVIRKKIAARGGEGGVKYVCDVCSADITSTVGLCFHMVNIASAFAPAHGRHNLPSDAAATAAPDLASRESRDVVGSRNLFGP